MTDSLQNGVSFKSIPKCFSSRYASSVRQCATGDRQHDAARLGCIAEVGIWIFLQKELLSCRINRDIDVALRTERVGFTGKVVVINRDAMLLVRIKFACGQ